MIRKLISVLCPTLIIDSELKSMNRQNINCEEYKYSSKDIQNTKNNLAGTDFLVKCIYVIHDATFKHRGGVQETIAEDYDDMLYQAESSENIEHGVQGISRTIVYAAIQLRD